MKWSEAIPVMSIKGLAWKLLCDTTLRTFRRHEMTILLFRLTYPSCPHHIALF